MGSVPDPKFQTCQDNMGARPAAAPISNERQRLEKRRGRIGDCKMPRVSEGCEWATHVRGGLESLVIVARRQPLLEEWSTGGSHSLCHFLLFEIQRPGTRAPRAVLRLD